VQLRSAARSGKAAYGGGTPTIQLTERAETRLALKKSAVSRQQKNIAADFRSEPKIRGEIGREFRE
jgi:hypothetical protein